MGICGSSSLEHIETEKWLPSNLNRETLIALAPELTGRKGQYLKSVKIEDLGLVVKRRKSSKQMQRKSTLSAGSSSTSAFTLSRSSSIQESIRAHVHPKRSMRAKISNIFSSRRVSGMDVSVGGEVLENGGSETGAQLRRARIEWNDKDADDNRTRPKTMIVKSTDIRDVPHMRILQMNNCIMRFLTKLCLSPRQSDGSRQFFLWDVIPRMIMAEAFVQLSRERAPERIRKLLPELYFTKIIGVQKPFPSISEWVWGGLGSVPTYFLSIGIEEFTKPYASAEGYTGSWKQANLSRRMVEFALSGMAQFHSAYWNMDKIRTRCELVSWIPEKRKGASTMTFFYPLTIGHWPNGMSLGDMDAPLST